MFSKVVNAVEVVALSIALVFVVLMFAYRPARARVPYNAATGATDARAIFGADCATCHGGHGEGGIGPRLAGVVATVFPNEAGEISIVTNGEDGMPAWGGRLTPAQIKAVVDYTRSGL